VPQSAEAEALDAQRRLCALLADEAPLLAFLRAASPRDFHVVAHAYVAALGAALAAHFKALLTDWHRAEARARAHARAAGLFPRLRTTF
jgi:hypothetical protein